MTIGEHNGTGIGLAYCKEAIEKHGGTISVYSHPDRGTLFSIMIPAAAIAACHISQSNLQIWSKDNKDESTQSWVREWQKNYKTNDTRQVRFHRFMLDHQEDSIDC